MTEVPPNMRAAIERIAAMPDTIERDGGTMPVASSMVLRPAEARALLSALDRQKQPDVSLCDAREALEKATSAKTLYYLRSIYRMLDCAETVLGYTRGTVLGHSGGSEALARNLDWIDCHIDWLERTARGTLSK